MDLADVHRELVRELRYGMRVVGTCPVAQIGDEHDEFAEQLQALGICHLLELADVPTFRLNLLRSGQSRRYYLQRSQAENNTTARHLALSRTQSFLDAVAGGALDLARDIARLSTADWHADWEYEDDYCYHSWLHRVVIDPTWTTGAESAALLDRFDASLEGGPSARYKVCRALLERDADAVSDGLDAFIEEEEARIALERGSGRVTEGGLTHWARRHVSVEALALLKIADLLDVPAPAELPLCPALARLPFADDTTTDVFAELHEIGT